MSLLINIYTGSFIKIFDFKFDNILLEPEIIKSFT